MSFLKLVLKPNGGWYCKHFLSHSQSLLVTYNIPIEFSIQEYIKFDNIIEILLKVWLRAFLSNKTFQINFVIFWS